MLRLYPWAVPAVVGLGVLASLAEGVGIGLFIPLLQSLTPGSDSGQMGNALVEWFSHLFAQVPPGQRLYLIAGCIFGSVLLRAGLTYGNRVLLSWVDTRTGHWLRSRIFEQLMSVSPRYLERSKTGRWLNILSTESWRTNEALHILLDMIVSACTLLVYVALLLLISWQLTLVVAAAMLTIALLVRLLTHSVERYGTQVTRTNAVLAERMVEGCEGMQTIRAFGREADEQARFDRASDRVARAILNVQVFSGAVQPVYEVLAGALLVLILLFTLQNPANLSALLVFIFVLYRLQPKVMGLDDARVKLASLAAAVNDATSLASPEGKPRLHSGDTPFDGLRRAIRLDDVTFHYDPADAPALRNVSLDIPVGETVAFVGPSGAGKSTLIKLILRFYDATSGAVRVDGTPLPELDLAAWRQRIALVSQDAYVFGSSVRANIAYGRPEATDAEIVAAAKRADAHAFIQNLPRGYDTCVGDRGTRLSGGQRQRLALARAIVRNPEILILDEATNALDSISENLIQEALETLRQDRTVLVIAHRLSTIAKADRIVVLEDGCVREQGTFEELISQDGLFAHMYALQHRTTPVSS